MIAVSDDQIADLKKAIADLAEAKRVSSDALSAGEFVGADLRQPPLERAVNEAPPLSQFLGRYRWVLASGVLGIVLGFLLATLV